MPDWNTRLAVVVQDDAGSTDITPIDQYTPTFTLTAEALHSLEATHIGAIFAPQALTFSMTVKAIGGAAGKLTQLALEQKRFEIHLQKSASSVGDDWSFDSVV